MTPCANSWKTAPFRASGVSADIPSSTKPMWETEL